MLFATMGMFLTLTMIYAQTRVPHRPAVGQGLARWFLPPATFNVIAGASAFPTDLREAAGSFHLKGWRWWIKVVLPGIFPYYITGAITASGGSWNASIVAEVASLHEAIRRAGD